MSFLFSPLFFYRRIKRPYMNKSNFMTLILSNNINVKLIK